MRNTMGRRIDGLNDVERDRLITAENFNDGRAWWGDGCGCLEGTIAHSYPVGAVFSAHIRALETVPDSVDVEAIMWSVPWHIAPASIRYPQAVARFGKQRVVRAIKARAGRPHAPLLPAAVPQGETVNVG